MSKIIECPRCAEHAFEKLKTYSHCISCFYFEDRWECPEKDVTDAIKTQSEVDSIIQQRIENQIPRIYPNDKIKKKGA